MSLTIGTEALSFTWFSINDCLHGIKQSHWNGRVPTRGKSTNRRCSTEAFTSLRPKRLRAPPTSINAFANIVAIKENRARAIVNQNELRYVLEGLHKIVPNKNAQMRKEAHRDAQYEGRSHAVQFLHLRLRVSTCHQTAQVQAEYRMVWSWAHRRSKIWVTYSWSKTCIRRHQNPYTASGKYHIVIKIPVN